MKLLESIYYNVVLAKFYMQEKQGREFDESDVYNAIWITFFTLFLFTECIPAFIYVNLVGIPPQYRVTAGISMTALVLVPIHLLIKRMKKDNYVSKILVQYIKMSHAEKIRGYKCGIYRRIIPILSYPLLVLLLLQLLDIFVF